MSYTPNPGGELRVADFLFTERTTAGMYTATLPLPAGTTVHDWVAFFLAGPKWAADSAMLQVGDVAGGADAYSDTGGNNVGQGSNYAALYVPTVAPNSTTSVVGWGYLDVGSKYQQAFGSYNGDNGMGVFYSADDVLTVKIVTTIASPPVVPVGILRVRVTYSLPVTVVDASFA